MKSKRQYKILELVREYEIETQGELTKLLSSAGFDVTQATVSRDIHEMRLIKIATDNGNYRYAAPEKLDQVGQTRLNRIFKDGFVSMDYANNLIVIRTFEGMAKSVAAAVDGMEMFKVVGTIAGDNAVLCIVKSEEAAIEIMEAFKRLMQ